MKLTLEQKEQLTTLLTHYPLSAAYLFGSQASGSTGPLSDVDIGVLFQKEVNKDQQEEIEDTIYNELGRILHTDSIDVINVETAPVLLRYNAMVKGKPLFIRNRIHHITEYMRSIHLFEDFLPYLNQIRLHLKKHFA